MPKHRAEQEDWGRTDLRAYHLGEKVPWGTCRALILGLGCKECGSWVVGRDRERVRNWLIEWILIVQVSLVEDTSRDR